MTILITSGGTRVPIDDVRSIVNFSSGKFGCHLAKQLLIKGAKVVHVRHVSAPHPFEFKVDLMDGRGKDYASQLEEAHVFSSMYMKNYISIAFDTYEEYAEEIRRQCLMGHQAIALAAAVSDYTVDKADGKISSDLDSTSINLVKVPKLISEIKERSPDSKLIGFKLLSNVKTHELTEAAHKQIKRCGCDFVVANDLTDLQESVKIVYVVDTNETVAVTGTSTEIASYIADKILEIV